MAKGTVLLTGASGFLGSHVASRLIDAGYTVRASFRSEAQGQHFRSAFAGKRVETCIVPDITASGAFSEAIIGAEFVIHAASPFTFNVDDIDKDLIQPAVQGTTRMLEAVASCRTVKRLVLTSSFAAVIDSTKGPRPGYEYTEKDWNPITANQALESKLFGYQASKTFAERAAWDFIASDSNKNHVTLVSICPPMIFGPVHPAAGISAEKLNESSSQLLNAARSAEPALTRMPVFVDVRDVAQTHVDAIDVNKVPRSERFVVCGGKYTWAAIKDIAHSGGASPEHMAQSKDFYSIGTSKVERMLGIKWTSLESSVEDCLRSLDGKAKI